jgi:hypothetical protein
MKCLTPEVREGLDVVLYDTNVLIGRLFLSERREELNLVLLTSTWEGTMTSMRTGAASRFQPPTMERLIRAVPAIPISVEGWRLTFDRLCRKIS